MPLVEIGQIIEMLGTDYTPASTKGSGSVADEFLSEFLGFANSLTDTDSGRHGDYLRGSGLYKLCPRREALLCVHPHHDRHETIDIGTRLTFDVGHALHWWWQNRYLGPMGRLWGDWYCQRCGEVTVTGAMPETCSTCNGGRSLFVYQEKLVVDDKLRYSGHPDGLLLEEPGIGRDGKPRFVFELKSISSSGFSGLGSEPQWAHVVQVHAYMRLVGVYEALIVYADKGKQCDWTINLEGFHAGRPHVRVFHVRYDASFWAEIEQRIKDHWRARALMTLEEAPTEEDAAAFARVCSHSRVQLARECPCKEPCWRLSAP
jgi:hypothetical protein